MRHGLVKGYAVLMKKMARVGVMRDGKQISVKATESTLLAGKRLPGFDNGEQRVKKFLCR